MKTLVETGGICIEVEIPECFGGSLLTEAYMPFIRRSGTGHAVSGGLRVVDVDGADAGAMHGDVVGVGFNDLGESQLYYDGCAYTVGISPRPGMEMRFMRFAGDFRSAALSLVPGDRWNSFVLDSMLRIFFSQVAVCSSAFLIHASAVETPAGVHMFMGSSGTGKSTHSSLWLGSFTDCELLNDDNPLVKLNPDGTASVAGTPWSGKTKCWRDSEAPLLSMTRLRQSSENKYTRLADVDAFVAVMPGVSVIAHSRQLYDNVCTTLGSVVGRTKVGILDCRPDSGAAQVCRDNVS